MDTNNFDVDLSILDQISQEFDDEISNLIFQEEEQCSEFDAAIDYFHDRFMDSMKHQDEGLKKQTSNTYIESNTKSA